MTNQPSSPPCGAAEADDVYIGYAGRNELLLVLNELLEAERAGAKLLLVGDPAQLDASAAGGFLGWLDRAVTTDGEAGRGTRCTLDQGRGKA